MARNTLSEMNVDLTSELASLMRLSVSDKWFVGKRFIDEFADSVIKNDIPKLRALCRAYHNVGYYFSESWYLSYQKNVLSVFNKIEKKLFLICSVSKLIEWLEIEYEHYGWGDMTIEGLKSLQQKGIEYINPDSHPYRYAEEGMSYIQFWCNQELGKNKCPFTAENALDYFFDFVDTVRKIQSNSIESDLYCYISSKGLVMVDRTTERKAECAK
ncbi:hypothetical protein N6F27_003466 [Escherichia coli]|nr:hypothetical protein [Escherichia coli]